MNRIAHPSALASPFKGHPRARGLSPRGRMKAASFVVAMLIAALIVLASILMHILFSREIGGLTAELLAAGVAVVLVVASVGVTIHFQNNAETERQYRVCLFENKMKEYTKFLNLTAKVDDDDRVDDEEVEAIRNQALVTAMLAGKRLLIHLADFVENLERTRELHGGSPEECTLQRVILSMREDLDVVDQVRPESKDAVERMVLRKRRGEGIPAHEGVNQ